MLLGRLRSGEDVVRAHRTILSRPGLEDLVRESLQYIDALERQKIIRAVNLRRVVGTTPLLKTTSADEIVYARRIGIEFSTRFVKNRDPEPTTFITVILHKYGNRRVFLLDTAFTGKMKHFVEPNEADRFAPTGEEREVAKRYWAERAWAWDPDSIVLGSVTMICPW